VYTQYENYIQRLIEKIQSLEQENINFKKQTEVKFQMLEEENNELKEKLSEIKPIHIENMNYKIQELHVKELTGTLNIGMTALTDPEKIKKWMSESNEEDITLNDMEQNNDEMNNKNDQGG